MNFLLALVFLSSNSLASDSEPDYCTAEITRQLAHNGCIAKVIPITESGLGSFLCGDKQAFLTMDHGKHRLWLESHDVAGSNDLVKELIITAYKTSWNLSPVESLILISSNVPLCTSSGVVWWYAVQPVPQTPVASPAIETK